MAVRTDYTSEEKAALATYDAFFGCELFHWAYNEADDVYAASGKHLERIQRTRSGLERLHPDLADALDVTLETGVYDNGAMLRDSYLTWMVNPPVAVLFAKNELHVQSCYGMVHVYDIAAARKYGKNGYTVKAKVIQVETLYGHPTNPLIAGPTFKRNTLWVSTEEMEKRYPGSTAQIDTLLLLGANDPALFAQVFATHQIPATHQAPPLPKTDLA